MTDQPIPRTIPLPIRCQHIFPDGHRCGSPALRREDLCFYHHPSHRRSPKPLALTASPSPKRPPLFPALEIPPLVDRAAILTGIGLVIHALAAGTIDARRAGRLIYCFQLAIGNLPQPQTQRGSRESRPPMT
jgi:hypothetical protein